MARARTFVRNLGATRHLPYIPPNGEIVLSGNTVVVPGILETELYMAGTSAYDAFVQDLEAGLIDVTYDFASSSDGDLSTLAREDHDLVPAPSGMVNGFNTTLTISHTPAADGMVEIFVNGVHMTLGDGIKTKEFYFSADGGVTARSIENIQVGDRLYFNAIVAGFALEASDSVSMVYCVAAATSSSSSP